MEIISLIVEMALIGCAIGYVWLMIALYVEVIQLAFGKKEEKPIRSISPFEWPRIVYSFLLKKKKLQSK